jgi:hypothetical protein
MRITLTKTLITSGAIAFALAGCSSSGSSPQTPNQAHPGSNVLQLAVGTANLGGTAGSLNVVTTYRQHDGDSGVLLDSPTLTLPAPVPGPGSAAAASYDVTATVLSGPTSVEAGTDSITSTSQSAGITCTTSVTSFGQSGGVFGLGIEPFNAQAQGDCTPAGVGSTGTPFQVPPYPVPLYDPLFGADPNAFIPWGGPPAFEIAGNPDSVVGSLANFYPAGTAGVPEGIDVFEGIAPTPGGAYSLSISIPANTGTIQQATKFTIPTTLTTLGTATSPAYTPDGNGGGTFAFTMPTGATEAYLELVDYGPAQPATGSAISCNGIASAGTPLYYTIETTASGTLTLPDLIGPTAPSSVAPGGSEPGTVPSVCTAALNTTANAGTATPDDQLAIQVIGFDYPAYESSYPNSLRVQAPAILGANGEDDITISTATCQAGATSCTTSLPLLRRREQSAHALPRFIHRR